MENLQSIMSHKRIIVHATLLGGQQSCLLFYQIKLYNAKLLYFSNSSISCRFCPSCSKVGWSCQVENSIGFGSSYSPESSIHHLNNWTLSLFGSRLMEIHRLSLSGFR